ncbi:hypothetical protein HPP92_022267 [Vanilla planifolia]|uniref:DUF7811 domain-containing protein n=1 Tax=Vanilla planifolia TaxID=51239 RepID=A0A835PTT1_VANPL|nr:hypothetical protein HPP92_022584 [Vanilla planifolia]KAG0459139.1 hypothetical protein HPP92_022267 [Vanilla planifolia]
MVESSALCFSSHLFPSLCRPADSTSTTKLSFTSTSSHYFRNRSLRSIRRGASDSGDGGGLGGDPYGPYPWEDSVPSDGSTIQWIPEDKITLFTSEGLIHIGGSLVPRHIPTSDKKQWRSKASQRFQRFQEANYMDPSQGLCLGALFDIAATNGLDLGRRLCIFGFCRSIEMLSDVVEDIVLEHGGEVVTAEKESKGGLQEKLTMTVAVPLLWGIPPASETLRFAVRSGGGIVEKVYWQWDFM